MTNGSQGDCAKITKRTRGYLPHWERQAGTYFVTFRLADSLPSNVLNEILQHRKMLAEAENARRKLLPVEVVAQKRLYRRRIEAYLDVGSGECLFKRPELADIVANALRFWDGKRCRLEAWCVMPNHVHVLFQLFPSESLEKLMGSWKSFTTSRINTALNRHGTLWQDESYDHLIRDDREFVRAVEYIRNNPIKAGLVGWRWVCVRGE